MQKLDPRIGEVAEFRNAISDKRCCWKICLKLERMALFRHLKPPLPEFDQRKNQSLSEETHDHVSVNPGDQKSSKFG